MGKRSTNISFPDNTGFTFRVGIEDRQTKGKVPNPSLKNCKVELREISMRGVAMKDDKNEFSTPRSKALISAAEVASAM